MLLIYFALELVVIMQAVKLCSRMSNLGYNESLFLYVNKQDMMFKVFHATFLFKTMTRFKYFSQSYSLYSTIFRVNNLYRKLLARSSA